MRKLVAVLVLFSPFILFVALGLVLMYQDDREAAKHDECIAEWVAAHPDHVNNWWAERKSDNWWAERKSDCQVTAPSPYGPSY